MARVCNIKEVIKECPYCQCASLIKPLIHALPYTLATFAPMALLSVDTIGPFPEDERGMQYVIAIIDCFTRFAEFYATARADAESAAQALLEHSGRYGFASHLTSDNGSQFVNETCDHLFKLMGTEKRVTVPYSHEQNGIIERLNKEFGFHIRALLFDKKVQAIWSNRYLPFVQRSYNNAEHSSTGVSPAMLMFGRNVDLDRGILYPYKENSTGAALPKVTAYLDEFLTAQSLILRAAVKHQLATDEYHVKVRANPSLVQSRKRKLTTTDTQVELTVYPVNSYVLCRNYSRESKFNNPWKGPFRVVEIHTGDEYILEDVLTAKTVRAHLQHLRAFNYAAGDETAPIQAAESNAGEFRIDSIVAHRGNNRARKTLEFLVHWQGYSDEYDSWEPWVNLRATLPLTQYLLDRQSLRYLVPAKHR